MPDQPTIHIPGDIQPFERGDRFEDPLDQALRAAGRLGKCVGGGTAMDAKQVTRCDVEVEVKDRAKAVPVIRKVLSAAAAPPGTTVTDADSGKVLLRYSAAGVKAFALPNPVKKKRFVDRIPGQPGEVVAYRLTRDRFVLLHLYGNGFFGPVLWVPETAGWCGPG